MKGKQRVAAILLAVFLVLVAGWVWVELGGPDEGGEDEAQPLWDLNPAQVTHVTVYEHGDLLYRVERDDQGIWHVHAPFERRADDQLRMENRLRVLADLPCPREFEPEEVDLEAFGLISPTATIEARLRGGETYTLQVGDLSPRQTTYYARWGNRVCLCPQRSLDYVMTAPLWPPDLATPGPTGASASR